MGHSTEGMLGEEKAGEKRRMEVSHKQERERRCHKTSLFIGKSWQPGLPRLMKILSWNCWGLSNLSAIPNLKKLAQEHHPDILFLSETLSESQKLENIRVTLKFEGCLAIDMVGRSRGITTLWKEKLRCSVMNFTRNYVNMVVNDDDKGDQRLTCYYDFPERGRRSQAWNMLREISNIADCSWCIVGDFNDLLSQEDKWGVHPLPTGCV